MQEVYAEIGTPSTGIWCDTCMLPSKILLPVQGLGEEGVLPLGTISACPDCGIIDIEGFEE